MSELDQGIASLSYRLRVMIVDRALSIAEMIDRVERGVLVAPVDEQLFRFRQLVEGFVSWSSG